MVCYLKYDQILLKAFGPGAGNLQFSTPYMYNVNTLWTKKGNIRKYATLCGGMNEDGERTKK